MTKIEWVKNEDGTQGYTVNPVKGLCPVGCSYCYARAMYRRFKWDPTVRYDPNWWKDIAVLRKPSRIFVGSTMELFHPACSEWEDIILWYCRKMSQHTFIFLTKMPENLPREWPDNCWVGVTATGRTSLKAAYWYLAGIKAKVKYLSLEPLLEEPPTASLLACVKGVDWLIIGQQTPVRKSTMPKVEWLQEIVEAADKAGVPVFLKDNLRPLLMPKHLMDDIFWASEKAKLRQELPEGAAIPEFEVTLPSECE